MENIHGVDVSWIHRPTNGLHRNASAPATDDPVIPTSESRASGSVESKSNGMADKKEDTGRTRQLSGGEQALSQQMATQLGTKSNNRRPGILSRPSLERQNSTEGVSSSTPSLKKRPSWISSLSSKLSSSGSSKAAAIPKGSPHPALAPSGVHISQTPQTTPIPVTPQTTDSSALHSSPDEPHEDAETIAITPPKPGSGFSFSSTFRRLSSGNPSQAPITAQADVRQCERKVLNIDGGRPRCVVKGLNPAKLRRVSFSVDVEIAGSSRYPVDEDMTADNMDSQPKNKEKKSKERDEGEALKHPNDVLEDLDKNRVPAGGEAMNRDPVSKTGDVKGSQNESALALSPVQLNTQPPPSLQTTTQHKEQAFVNQKISTQANDARGSSLIIDKPATLKTNFNESNHAHVPGTGGTPHKSKDKPTTDPLRIYRRCCQLREAPVLKRISEQLGSPSNYGPEAPGVVTCLNLNRSRMQLPDIVCLGDWLAVVPVKKLFLDDANLTDEGIRIILAGVLAAKPPELHRRRRGRSSPTRLRDQIVHRTPGVIEKLTLKNNRKLTAEAWRHICTFLNMSRSIKAVDLSMVTFPRSATTSNSLVALDKHATDIDELLFQSLSTRLGGDKLAELTFGECGLDDGHVAKIAAAATHMRLQRLGLAGNRLTSSGLGHVSSYLKAGVCKGLDLGGVDLHGSLSIILSALDEKSPLQAISFANCNLDVGELRLMMETLVILPDLRFLDLSHNRNLFLRRPTALSVLRHSLPQLPLLKRLHLMDVSLSSADAIGIAEIVPEMRNLAHLNILENPQLAAIALATDSASSEEACALFASLMTAVRLSRTMVCVDIDVPSQEASEVVRALARQVVAYCLRNMEIFTQGDAIRVADAAAALPDIPGADNSLLQDIVGRDNDVDIKYYPASAKNEDYLVGGQGWVKALSHCLNAADLRKMSVDGSSSPSQVIESEAGRAKAKDMSKDLLVSARNFRQRLQSVLAREEASNGEVDVLKRLQFLDQTIITIIERFEHEYPDTRIPTKPVEEPPQPDETEAIDPSSLLYPSDLPERQEGQFPGVFPGYTVSPISPISSSSSRRGSATDLASFALATEEANFHRFGQRFRREVLPPSGQDDRLHGTSSRDPQEPVYMSSLRKQMEAMGSDELREKVRKLGFEATLKEFNEEKDRLKFEEVRRGSLGS